MKFNLLPMTVLAASLLTSYAHVHAATVMFEIEGIKNDAGKIYLSLFKGEENYQSKKAEAWQIVKPESGSKTVIFNDLAAGEYVIQYFHDENDNSKLEKNLFGSPTEGYGFSNDAKPSYGPASYEEMKIVVSDVNETVINKSTVIYK